MRQPAVGRQRAGASALIQPVRITYWGLETRGPGRALSAKTQLLPMKSYLGAVN